MRRKGLLHMCGEGEFGNRALSAMRFGFGGHVETKA